MNSSSRLWRAFATHVTPHTFQRMRGANATTVAGYQGANLAEVHSVQSQMKMLAVAGRSVFRLLGQSSTNQVSRVNSTP